MILRMSFIDPRISRKKKKCLKFVQNLLSYTRVFTVGNKNFMRTYVFLEIPTYV